MASVARRRPQNAPGPFFVDDTCIDCDTCRWMAPETFHREGGMSAVYAQPGTAAASRRALQAVVSCPTASIGTDPRADGLAQTRDGFPLPVEYQGRVLEDVFHCGYHSRHSFGAASYLVRTAAGNVLIDSPRYAAPLVKGIEALGGLQRIVLTHQDDVADWQRYSDHFGCGALIHEADADAAPGAATFGGEEPMEVLAGFTAIPVPGHTRGHTVFLWDDRVLFTGDHLAWSDRRQALVAFRRANWYSWPETIRSMERLTQYRFEWVLPGHGRRVHLPPDRMQAHLADCIAWMRSVA